MDVTLEDLIARVVAAEVRKAMRDRGDGQLGYCTSASPLLVRVHGDTASVPASALGGWTAAVGPVLVLRVAGRLFVTEIPGV